MPSDNSHLAAQIKALRTDRGISQKAVSEALGVSQPAYHALENGDTAPTLSYLVRLAEFFGLSPADAFPDYELADDELTIVGQRWRDNPTGRRLADIAAA